MKERELANHTTCNLCNRLITSCGLPLFWRVKVERFGLDARAMRKQAGLGMMLGSPALAEIMGTDADMAKSMMDEVTLTVCEGCAMDNTEYIIGIAMSMSAAADAKKEPT